MSGGHDQTVSCAQSGFMGLTGQPAPGPRDLEARAAPQPLPPQRDAAPRAAAPADRRGGQALCPGGPE